MSRRRSWQMELITAGLWFVVAGASTAMPEAEALRRMQAGIVQVEALLPEMIPSWGSAVRVAENRYATACHIVRNARRIVLHTPAGSAAARSVGADFYHDLCVLAADEKVKGTSVEIERTPPQIGDTVFAVGFPGAGRLVISAGRVYVRHEVHGGALLQTSAAFENGASGGGLFDEYGRLVAVLSFRAQADGPFYFALPVSWLDHLPDISSSQAADGSSLWMLPLSEQPAFLQAVTYTAQRDWRSLLALVRRWGDEDRDAVAPWVHLGTAYMKLGQTDAAAAAYSRAVAMDPQQLDNLRRLRGIYADAHNAAAVDELTRTLAALGALEHARAQGSTSTR